MAAGMQAMGAMGLMLWIIEEQGGPHFTKPQNSLRPFLNRFASPDASFTLP
jgi:hypothetical protein